MGDCQLVLVGDVTASKFYHVPNYTITTLCPHCGERSTIQQCERGAGIPDELSDRVGYQRVGKCTRCHNKLIIGFKL